MGGGTADKKEYITRHREYELVYDKGNSWACELLVLKATPNDLNLSRCGFSVSKRVGNAVTRNRIKLLLREIWRLTPLTPGWDIVFIARPAAAAADYASIKKAVENLLSRAHLLATASVAV